LSTSRKSGVLVLRAEVGTGRLFLRKGQIYYATLEDGFDVAPRKALFRMLSWNQGFFELEPPDDRSVLEELQDSTEALLMGGMRQLDEFTAITQKLPPLATSLQVVRPLTARLRDLKPEELDVLQLALSGDTVQSVLDRNRGTDLDTAQAVQALISK